MAGFTNIQSTGEWIRYGDTEDVMRFDASLLFEVEKSSTNWHSLCGDRGIHLQAIGPRYNVEL